MVFLYIILSLLALILLLFLLMILLPFTICINTNDQKYQFKLSFLFRAKYIQDDKSHIHLRILFYPVKLDLSKKGSIPLSVLTSRDEKESKKKKSAFSFRMIKPVWHTLAKIINSFNIRRFDVSFDTGDFPLNAQLVPVLYHISGRNMHFSVNFQDENYAIIELKNNLFSFIRYGLPLYFKLRKIRRRKKQ